MKGLDRIKIENGNGGGYIVIDLDTGEQVHGVVDVSVDIVSMPPRVTLVLCPHHIEDQTVEHRDAPEVA